MTFKNLNGKRKEAKLMLHTMFGDFRSSIPMDGFLPNDRIRSWGESAADAQRREAREAEERLRKFCRTANAPTPEVLEGIEKLIQTGRRYETKMALKCWALPNEMFAEIAEKTIARDDREFEFDVVKTICARLRQMEEAVMYGENALREGRSTARFWWFDGDLQFDDPCQEELGGLKRNLAVLKVTIPEILMKSHYFWTWAQAARWTSSRETLVELARKCAKLKKSPQRRNELVVAIVKSPVLSEQAVFELMQTPRWADNRTRVTWYVWIRALETGKLNQEIVEYTRKLIAEERKSELYEKFRNRWFTPEYFDVYSDDLRRMKEIVEYWAQRHDC